MQDLEEGVRTHKLDLETEIKMAVGIGNPCIAWKTWLTLSTSSTLVMMAELLVKDSKGRPIKV